MYFLRLKPLKDDLVREGLPEKQKYHYILAWGILGAIVSPFVGVTETGPASAFMILGLLLITIFGVRYAYRRNGGERGSALLDRWISIGWVVNFRVIIVLYLVVTPIVSKVGVFRSLGSYVDYFMGTVAGVFMSEVYFNDSGLEGLLVVVILLAEIYVVRAVGKHIGEVHEAADSGAVPGILGPAPVSPAPPPGGGSVLMTPPGLDSGASQQLERFVETVVQRELATGEAPAPRKRAARTRPAAVRPRKNAPRKRAKRR